MCFPLLLAEDHETDFEYEGSDNEEDEVQEGEPRYDTINNTL